MRNLLLDTGAFVALLDKSEDSYERCVDFFRSFKGEIFTTEPVLTETLYLLGPSIIAEKNCIDFILKGGAALVPQSAASLSRAITLMEKYKDIPMDFADATLVAFAEDADINEIFTLDLRGFNAYRIHGKRTFEIWPK
ncbi:MAG: PIN domain-containing protein [Nitrospirae bacterium]|nr:PIN domain-containing protein [Nitrospirota bacterium]